MNFPTYPRNGPLFPPFAANPCVKMIGSFSNLSPICHFSVERIGTDREEATEVESFPLALKRCIGNGGVELGES